MEENPGNGSSGGNETDQFVATGRTGRRNAVPDINEDKNASTSTSDLPEAMEKLTCGSKSFLHAQLFYESKIKLLKSANFFTHSFISKILNLE